MPDTTTRAYTIKLAGDDDWRSHLWSTHVAVNRGAWAWGEWLLTLRGGLPASLADDHPKRRVLLAMSWLSVESPESLVKAPIVARADDDERAGKVLDALRQILADQGVQDAEVWLADCTPALSARIRDDAVWVDRHAAFEKLQLSCKGLTASWAQQTLFDLLGGEADYFHMPDADAAAAEAKDFVQKAGGWLSRNWGSGAKSDTSKIVEVLRSLTKVDAAELVGKTGLQAIKQLHSVLAPCDDQIETSNGVFKSLKQQIGWKGRPSKGALALDKISQAKAVDSGLWEQTKQKLQEEVADQAAKAGNQGATPEWMGRWRTTMESPDRIGVPYRCDRDLIWEHGVMLDHALRRVSSAHSWIKRAEVSRRQFYEDATKPVDERAKAWLDKFCEERTVETGGQRDYVIHKRALDGWDKIVERWKRCASLNDEEKQQQATGIPPKRSDGTARSLDECVKIAESRDFQANLEDNEKLGDMTLFERLATDEARCVWMSADGKATPQILKDYSAAQVARHNQQRFKVPAYRHPDPLRNPIYVDFGNSRWSISYSALQSVKKRSGLPAKIAKAKTEKTRAKLQAQLDEAPNLRGVTLGLWTGEQVEDVPLRWQGKRLWNDLDLDHFDQPGEATVTRADRLGRVVHNTANGGVTVAEVFKAKDWNGRLQAPRKQLDRLADLVYGKKEGKSNGADYAKLDKTFDNKKAKQQFNHLRWFLTTSAKLKPSGPWWNFVEAGLPPGVEYKKRRSGSYLNYEANTSREGRARLRLAGIPGIRVLSFDLGHRYGASCAVWETLSEESLDHEIAGREVTAGGLDQSALYLHTKHTDERGKPRRTIYRRTAADMWARLERQFVIRLQGEDRAARWALAEELKGFESFREFLGLKSLAGLGIHKLRIDELQHEAVREARYGLRRLGDIARIAYAMTAKNKPLSGGRDSNEFTDEERIAYVAEALARWRQLKAKDPWADQQWQSQIANFFDENAEAERAEEATGAQRKRQFQAAVEKLKPTAEKLIKKPTLATDLNKLWTEHYHDLESQWKQHLRWLRRLILPRKGEFKRGNVGGLSVQRLQTIRGLYECLRAFRMRPEPDDLRKNVPALGDESLARFGRRILDKLERLREQRIKQLASRVVEAALGAGRMKTTRGRDRKRPDICVDKPCHAVIAENLKRYRPEETRLRKENRRLMDWAARNVRKYVVEGCELNGLHFEEVPAAYTSQQDSRTGAPGIRCEDIPIEVLKVAIEEAKAAAEENVNSLKSLKQKRQAKWLAGELGKLPSDDEDCSPRQRILLAVRNNPTVSLKNAVRLPRRGGELFVSSDQNSPAAAGLQADLNAAANIGLKALMHPDYVGSWWFVLVDKANGKPVMEKVKGSTHWDNAKDEALLSPADAETVAKKPKKSKKRERTSVYAWNPLHGNTSANNSAQWKPTAEYKAEVELLIVQKLLPQQANPETPW